MNDFGTTVKCDKKISATTKQTSRIYIRDLTILYFLFQYTYTNMEDVERALLIKNEVFVYKIPPRTSAKGYRAADWKLDAPDWTGRLRCIEKGTVPMFEFCPLAKLFFLLTFFSTLSSGS